MRVINLDRRVSIEQQQIARNASYGSEVVTWALLATVWALVMEKAAAETVGLNERVLSRQITVRIRYRSDVTAKMRVNHGGRLLNIMGTVEVGRKDYLDLACEEYSV